LKLRSIFLRIILGGTFDRFPRFQILIGHMGEALPFMLPRLDTMNLSVTKLNRPISAYLRENVYYTFSGFNYTPTFLNLLLEVGVDRIMFSADYPYQSMSQARAFWTGCRSAPSIESASCTGTRSSFLCCKRQWHGHGIAGWSPGTASGSRRSIRSAEPG
jgi:Amidohydrolase